MLSKTVIHFLDPHVLHQESRVGKTMKCSSSEEPVWVPQAAVLFRDVSRLVLVFLIRGKHLPHV